MDNSLKTPPSWVFHAFTVVLAYSFSFSTLKIGSQIVDPLFFAMCITFSNALCHSTNLGRLKFIKKQSFTIKRYVVFLGLATGAVISINNFSSAIMFKIDAPMSIAVPFFSTGIVLMSVFYGFIVFKERLTGPQWAGVALSVMGIYLINV